MLILNSLFPVFALIVLGAALKHYKITQEAFLKTSDRLVYFIFFPALLFWKVGGASLGKDLDISYISAALIAHLVIYILSTVYIFLSRMPSFQAGSFSQSCYRFNTYVAMAVVLNALGEEGVALLGLLIGISIPIINVLAVATLIGFDGKRRPKRQRLGMMAKALVSNPLILGCLAGILYSRMNLGFPVFLDNTLRLAATVTLPLALISIGGALTFKNLNLYLGSTLVAAGFKLLLLPLIGYLLLDRFQVTGLPLKVAMLYFAMPTSTALYVLSAQLNSDTSLASATIMVSTILSFFSLSAVLWLF